MESTFPDGRIFVEDQNKMDRGPVRLAAAFSDRIFAFDRRGIAPFYPNRPDLALAGPGYRPGQLENRLTEHGTVCDGRNRTDPDTQAKRDAYPPADNDSVTQPDT